MSDLVTIWEWEGGWKLVRAKNRPALQSLYLKLTDEANFGGRTDADRVDLAIENEGVEVPMFVLDSTSSVVMLVKLIDVDTPADPGWAILLTSGLYGSDRSGTGRWTLSLEMSTRWLAAVLRLYGMAAALRPGISITKHTGSLLTTTHFSEVDPGLGEVIREYWSFPDFVDRIQPWFIEGYPPEGTDYEIYRLLGILPPAFVEPLIRNSLDHA